MPTYDTASAKVASFLMKTMTDVDNAYATKVRSRGFYGNTVLKTAKFAAITAIESMAFQGCTALKSVDLPNTLTTIASTAFTGCTALTKITIALAEGAISGAPWGATNATVIWAGTELIIDSNDGFLESYKNNIDIVKVTITSNVTAIPDNAFIGCTNLATLIIGSSVATIGDTAFSGCTSLTSVTIPAGVTEIGTNAFASTSITTISISKEIDTITGSPWGATNATVTWAGDEPINLYDDTVTDINGYMRYADHKFNYVNGSTDYTSNAVTYFLAEANSTYAITMSMDSRFRAWSYNGMPALSGLVMSNYVIHSKDDNTSTSQNGATETVTITTGASDDRVFIGYWTSSGDMARLDVRNTINVVKEG